MLKKKKMQMGRVNKLTAYFNNKQLHTNKIILVYFLFFSALLSKAQVSITALGTPHTENFNGIGNTSNATLPTGFVVGSDWLGGLTSTNKTAGTTGTGILTSTSISGNYNLANGDSATSSDRAIGFLADAGYKAPRSVIFAFTNNTGNTVTQANISWNYEKYRTGGAVAYYYNFYHGSSTNTLTLTTSAQANLGGASLSFASTAGLQAGMSVYLQSPTGQLSPYTVINSVVNATVVGISPAVLQTIPIGSTIVFKSTATTRADSTVLSSDAGNNSTIFNPPTQTSKSVTLTGLNILNGTTYYLRWYFNGTTTTASNSVSSQVIGIDDISVSLSDGSCSPYRQAAITSISNVLAGQMDVNYTRANGDSVLIVASTSSSLTSDPVNGTFYNASGVFGSGSLLGGGYVVYKGIASGINSPATLTVTGLNSSTPYYFFIYEYNRSGTGTGTCYKIPAATLGQSTVSAANDYFRSRQSGNWNDPNTWETSCNNINWAIATLKPTNAARSILIRDSVTITNTAETARLLTVSAGAKLTYTTATGYSGGNTLTVSDDPSGFDFMVYGTYIVFGNPAVFEPGATAKVFNGGLVRADGNSGGKSDDWARSASVYFSNGSVFEWNTVTALQSSSVTYFLYNTAQPRSDVAVFKISRALTIGASGATVINGLVEINAPVTIQSAGIKTFRNGLIGSGTLTQSSVTNISGAINITDTAIIGGTGTVALNANGIKITASSIATLVSDKNFTSGTMTVDGMLYTSTYAVTGTCSFILSANGSLGIGSPNGINASAFSGNIQSASRVFNAAANYIYNGASDQYTGDGLPALITGSLSISNSGIAGNNTVTLVTYGTETDSLILSRGLLATGVGSQLQITGGGYVYASGGNIVNGPTGGTINFKGNGSVVGTATSLNFYNVNIAGAVNFGSSVTSYINATLKINTGGSINTHPPVYNTGSFLKYNTGGTFARGLEFSSTTGRGYPYHLQISNNTLLDVGNSALGTARQIAGNLTIDAGSTFSLNNGSNDMTASVTISGDININGALSLSDAPGGNIYVKGNWNRSATGVFQHNQRAVYFTGDSSSDITASAGEVFYDIYLQKSLSGNKLNLNDPIFIQHLLKLNTGTFDLLDKDATLLSSASGTAQFGEMGNNSDVSYSGLGRFVVERFLPAGTNPGQHGKCWQFLSIPTNGGQTINQAWQEGAVTPFQDVNPGYGLQLSGPNGGSGGATALGFDFYSVAPSMKTLATDTSWVGVPNTTTTPIYNEKGYMVFVRGDRSVTNYYQPATSTTLRTRGKLFVPVSNPPAAIVLPASGYASIGNPYASAIEFSTLDAINLPDVDPVFYVWDPLLTGTNGFGGYQTLSSMNPAGDFFPIPGGTANYPSGVRCSVIQSGQAFMMHSSGSGGTLHFFESNKTSGASNPFRSSSPIAQDPFVQVFLYTHPNQVDKLADGALVTFSNRFSSAIDRNDALKMTNSAENLSISNRGKLLSLDARSAISKNDTVFLNVKNLRQQSYQFRFLPSYFPVNTYKISLFDKWNQQTTLFSDGDTSYYNFTVSGDPSSFRPDRFYITILRKNTRLAAPAGNNTPLTIAKDADTPRLCLNASSSIEVYPNPAIDNFNLLLHSSTNDKVTVRIRDIQGKLIKSLSLYPNRRISFGADLQRGLYLLETIEGAKKKTLRLIKL